MKYFMEPRNPGKIWAEWADDHVRWAILQIILFSAAVVVGIPALLVYILG